MSAASLDRLERLFLSARLLPPGERAAFLDAACADDPALREELARLLAADAEADAEGFLDDPAPPLQPLAAEELDDLVGQQAGPYLVQRRLGGGGMGDVYLALRTEPFKRYVALKVIRPGTGSREVLQRFAMERQILAALDHPHIARLLDSGRTDDGRPFLVMEFVDGRPITDYCDAARMTIRDRLRLFADVCRAVHSAHQNLVLHRDLKPSNVLVTAHGAPKLLDFGIAKLLNPNLSHPTAPVTRTAAHVMTPEYASPEQVRGEPLTTASDVYSLGVLLYELLTGRRPYRLAGRSTAEVLRVVSEEEPERPSARVLPSGVGTGPDGAAPEASAETVSETRSTTPERLRHELRGDLDTIVLMALHKAPPRRYASAEALAEDVDRYLAGLPVRAHGDSPAYRLRKFVRRHRTQAVSALLVAASLVAGLGAALWQAHEARRERDRAHVEAAKAEQVTAFVLSLFERADPTTAPGDTVDVRELLDRGAARIDVDLREQPAVQADLLRVIAHAFGNLGRYERSADLLERVLALRRSTIGEVHETTMESLYELAEMRARQERFAEAEALLRRYVAAARGLHGDAHVAVLRGSYQLWGMLHHQGRAPVADSLFAVLLALEQTLPPADDPIHAATITEMAYALAAMRRYDEAEAYVRKALAMERRLHGDEHPRVAFMLSRLAGVLNVQERYADAEPYAREAVELNRLFFPEGHDQRASGLYHLGRSLHGLGRLDEAAEALEEAVAMLRRLHGDDHRSLAQYARALAAVYDEQGRPEAALAYRALAE